MKAALFILLVALVSASAAEFPAIYNSEDPSKAPTSAAEALTKFRLPPGFKVTLFAGEPDVQQPIAMTFDARGRLWVAENYTYAEGKLNFDRNLRDRIVIFEDTDGDGKFDRRKVFWDQAQLLTSIEIGFGGVWALCAPNLLFIPDRDGDDVPDGEPEILLDGWDTGPVRHNIVNGLKWGPDGWLYGRHGIQGTSRVGRPVDGGRWTVDGGEQRRENLNCAIWRFHPVRRTFEVVTRGTTNPWGMDWNEYGEAFFINTVIGHLWHIIPGAHYQRMYGEDFDADVYGLIDQHADHYHWNRQEAWSDIRKGVTGSTAEAGGGHAHIGLMIYSATNWPAAYRGRVFTLNMHGRRINQDRLERLGSGYVGRHEPDPMFSDDPWFRAIDLIYGPDGGVYVADWSDTGECHEQDGVHRTSGRIYKITYGETAKMKPVDLGRLTDAELVRLQLHENEWFARQSRRLLQERALRGSQDSTEKAATIEQLRGMVVQEGNDARRLRALWTLHAIGGAEEKWLVSLLGNSTDTIRVWAIRLLTDALPLGKNKTELSEPILVLFTYMATKDRSAAVRLALASTLQRLPVSQRATVAGPLLKHREDANDHNLPLMLWYGVKDVVNVDAAAAVKLAMDSQIPLVRKYIARRLGELAESKPEGLNALLSEAMNNADVRGDILAGLSEGFRGRRQASRPVIWDKFAEETKRGATDEVRQQLTTLSLIFGSGRALEELQSTALDDSVDLATRRAALRSLMDHRAPGLRSVCERLLNQRELAGAAATGLAMSDDPDVAELLTGKYGQVNKSQRPAFIAALVTRPAFAKILLTAVADGEIPRADITAFDARQIRSLGDPELTRQLAEVWGEVRETDEGRRQAIARYRKQLTPARIMEANRDRGRELFQKACASCHRLFGEGGNIGPELTGSGRTNVDYLLENVVDPNGLVAADYRMSVVTMKDGRVLNGVVLRRTERTLELQGITERTVLDASDVSGLEQTKLSLMPEGLLDAFNDEQVRDLMGYMLKE